MVMDAWKEITFPFKGEGISSFHAFHGHIETDPPRGRMRWPEKPLIARWPVTLSEETTRLCG